MSRLHSMQLESKLGAPSLNANMYKTVRSQAVANGKNETIHLPLEFEGKRAFVIWDSVRVGDFHFKTRIEINPRLLRRLGTRGNDYQYKGKLVLPCPGNN